MSLVTTAPSSPIKHTEKTEVLDGVENTTNTIFQFLCNARSGISACSPYPTLPVIMGAEYERALVNLKNRGVKVRQITEITKENARYCKEQVKNIDELRHLDGVKANFAVSETEYVATSTLREAQPVPEVIYSNVKDVVEQQQYLFETLWKKSTSAEEKIRQFEEGTTPEYFEVFTDRDREVVSQILLELAKSVREEALILLPNARAMVRVDRLGFIGYIIEASQKGATVKIICPMSDENLEILKKISEQAPAVTILNGDNCLYGVYIIDSKKFLRAELRDPKAEKFSEAIGFTVYSNSKVGVDSLRSVFELLWKERKLNEDLKIHDKMQQEFINIASHEIRTPTQAILGYSKLIQQHPERREEMIEAIVRNATRLQRLTNDILDVTRIETQSLKLNVERVNLNELISDIIEDQKNEIEKTNKDIRLVHERQDQNIEIDADKNRLTQVISNLLSNAIKFTKEGTIRVTEEVKDSMALVTVMDTGRGIDPEISPRLFSKFAAKSETGMGLGLFISKSIVEAHGGKIWAQNNTDYDGKKGATFTFSIPLSRLKEASP
ncbi:MAG TPA: ATP-binding protein [Candidatus Acidoferrum sp.]|nr:ATP-binding protein [Candidatus Acidoferrum sp.]